MDLAGNAREYAPEHGAVKHLAASRRATWGPTIRTHLDTSTLDETFLKKAADLASRRPSNASSLSSSTAPAASLARPAASRLQSTPEHRPSARTDPPPGHTLNKRHTAYAMDKRKAFASAGSLKNPLHMANVRRWDARARTTDRWDGLQRDPELFSPSGELLVHLHARGHSRRGPSFRVSLNRVHKMRCGPMFTLCYATETDDSRVRRMPGAPRIYEVFIPSPQGMLREDAFNWHLTTRNFFAFLYGKPLVAVHLGKALVDLRERMNSFRAEEVDNHKDMMDFLDAAGYLNFGHRPDYALAVLQYAEHFKLRDLWIDAFAHCVGMSSILMYSPEYQCVRRSTKSLVNRAAVEMDLEVSRGVKAMSNFLEDGLSNSHLGLGAGARQHLDRFRSFLQQYYLEKFGYWPPRKDSKFQKDVYKSMYFEVKGLYEYLADTTSSDSLHSQGLASGGICVLQNVQAFDRRHQFPSLPHPLPLLPEVATGSRAQSNRKSFLQIALGKKSSRASQQHSIRTALHAATNTGDLSIVNAPLVKAYRQFERDYANLHKEEKITLSDARKVRWIMIYCVLQTLISVTRAPAEVRNADRTEYPLCCTSSCLPPWEDDTETMTSPTSPATTMPFPDFPRPGTSGSQTMDMNGMPTLAKPLPSPTTFEIHPDCENDAGYFGKSRSNSTQSLASLAQTSETPVATNGSTQNLPLLRRNSSKASQASERSIKGLSFSSFNPRRNSAVARPPSAYCEIIIHGYGNGLNETIVSSTSTSPTVRPESSRAAPPALALAAENDDSGLTMRIKSRPRPMSSYTPSSKASASAILAPQPVRPMSAHERKSFKLPAKLTSLDTGVTAEEMRTPTLEISQVDRLKDMMPKEARRSSTTQAATTSSSVRTTPVSASDGTGSEHNVSPVWSSRRGSTSSQSSAEVFPVEPEKLTVVEDMAGFVDSTPTVELQLRDVGGLLQPSPNPARRGILVHRTFSVERFRVPTATGSSGPAGAQGVRRVRDHAVSAAQRTWKRKSVRYTPEANQTSENRAVVA